MNSIYLTLVVIVVIAGLIFAINNQTTQDPKYKFLMSLPNGISVTHSPSNVMAQQGGRSGQKFTWLHETTVESTVQDLSIIEFGAFVDHHEKWIFSTYTDKPFTSSDFEEWFSCKDSKLEFGKQYTDPSNWTGSDVLEESKTMWYYIGVNSSGEKFKGTSIVKLEAKSN